MEIANLPSKDNTNSSSGSSKNTFNFSPFTTATGNKDTSSSSSKDVKKDNGDSKPALLKTILEAAAVAAAKILSTLAPSQLLQVIKIQAVAAAKM